MSTTAVHPGLRRRALIDLGWIALFLITCGSLSFAAGYWGAPPTPPAPVPTTNAPASPATGSPHP